MRKVLMKETAIGSIDGIKVQSFEKGQVYNVSDDLFDNFVNMQKVAEDYKSPKVEKKEKTEKKVETELKKKEEKAVTETFYDNKMYGENKTVKDNRRR